MNQYRTVDNDRLDLICARHYGTVAVLVNVLEDNPGLCEQPEWLPSGIIINLPELRIEAPKKTVYS